MSRPPVAAVAGVQDETAPHVELLFDQAILEDNEGGARALVLEEGHTSQPVVSTQMRPERRKEGRE